MKLVKIYCGRSKPDGSLISLQSVNKFIEAEVATQYEGFTITYTVGYWQGKREESFVIEVVTDPVSHLVDYRHKQVANAYKKDFDQQDVLITIQDVEIIPV